MEWGGNLPTLTAKDSTGKGYTYDGGDKTKPRLSLTGIARSLLPTLQAHDAKKGIPERANRGSKKGGCSNLNDVLGGTLNPPWCDWFMGWPIGWSGLEPLGMDRFQSWLHEHGGN